MTSRLQTTRPTEYRRAKGRCPVCRKYVYRGGIRHSGRFWHVSCFRKSPEREHYIRPLGIN